MAIVTVTGNADEGPTSGFIKPDEILNTYRFTDLTPVPSRGFSQLTRAKRHGRWWMLKGLKEQYREDAVYRALLQKEYEITSQLQHPMVVSAFSFEDVEGLGPCIVMEWIEGITLREWLLQGNHTRKQRRHVADMLTEALAYVHSRQTQHRDLKPSNIMLTHEGHNLKLIDFGLSDTDSHAILKESVGTAGYMAPEGPSDIYSLGCILRELHTGWFARKVIRKCCAPLEDRYTDVTTIQRDLHRSWQWPLRIFQAAGLALLLAGLYLWNNPQTVYDLLAFFQTESKEVDSIPVQIEIDQPNAIIDFADPKVKAICVAHWDTNGDGELSRAEAAAVNSLGYVFNENKEITSFEELQYFIGLTSIGDAAFRGCSGLTSVTIPNSVTSIGQWSFTHCSALLSIIIPANVTDIGVGVFAGCNNMISMTVDAGNTAFDSRNDCNAIIETSTNTLIAGCQNMTIPEGVTTIRKWAMNGITTLKSVVLPNSLTSIGEGAFSYCLSLTSITIPANVTSIGNGAFEGCNRLTSVTIGNSVTSIGNQAFQYCSGLTSLTIPNSVTSIGSQAFNGCSGLTSVTIGNSATSIGNQAFQNCSGLTSITIPNSVTSIGNGAFEGCNRLTSVTIPGSVTSIGKNAFRVVSLTTVKVENSVPVPIKENTFPSPANATLYVPAGSKAVYESADFWKDFKTIKEF